MKSFIIILISTFSIAVFSQTKRGSLKLSKEAILFWEIKDFNKQYGDFFSPIQSDMDWYNKNVIGAARDQLNDLYSSGIDPARSAEGRAIISRFIN